jgi:hypothetical protein
MVVTVVSNSQVALTRVRVVVSDVRRRHARPRVQKICIELPPGSRLVKDDAALSVRD